MLPRNLNWSIIGPIALIAVVLLLIVIFDQRSSGEAEPPELLGEVGTPVRGTFVPPTATPIGARPTPLPRPTVAGAPGTPEERDATRRSDLLIVLNALNAVREDEGEFPETGNNIQTLCAFKDLDVGCDLSEELGRDTPTDPLGNPVQNGYWYQSDGRTLKLYASLEGDIPDSEQCPTDNVDLETKANLICITAP